MSSGSRWSRPGPAGRCHLSLIFSLTQQQESDLGEWKVQTGAPNSWIRGRRGLGTWTPGSEGGVGWGPGLPDVRKEGCQNKDKRCWDSAVCPTGRNVQMGAGNPDSWV